MRKDSSSPAADEGGGPVVERDQRDRAARQARVTDKALVPPPPLGPAPGSGVGAGTVPPPPRRPEPFPGGTSTILPAVASSSRRHALPGEPEPSGPLLGRAVSADLQGRMRDAVATFVDSPDGAVTEADALLRETVRAINEALEERRSDLTAQRAKAGSDTEQLRLALVRYRAAIGELLKL